MERGRVKLWYDPEGDYLEVLLEEGEGYFRETSDDRIMEKVDMNGKVIGFSVMKVGSLKGAPVDLVLS